MRRSFPMPISSSKLEVEFLTTRCKTLLEIGEASLLLEELEWNTAVVRERIPALASRRVIRIISVIISPSKLFFRHESGSP